MVAAIRVGVAGWSYPDWAGVVYPDRRARGGVTELAYLARYVDAMEINTSFYRPPTAEMTAKWLQQVADRRDFVFTAKLWQRFTHQRDLPWSSAEARMYSDGLAPLREAGKLSALLWQFPWSFKPSDSERDWLAGLAEQFNEFNNVVEVRHRAWDTPENIEFLRAHNLGFCNIDQPHISANLRETNYATGPVAYYRFHGRNAQAWFNREEGTQSRNDRYNYLYAARELAPWEERIAATASEGRVQQLFVIANNHYRGQAVANALEVKSHLTGKRVPVPEPLVEVYPELKDVAIATSLF